MLTGRLAWRRGWFGRLILRVEERVPSEVPGSFYLTWRDARQTDLAALGLATLKGK